MSNKVYKALVYDRNLKKEVIVESEYPNKKSFIKDLRLNGYRVNEYYVKEVNIFNWILENTNSTVTDWININKLPSLVDYNAMESSLKLDIEDKEFSLIELESLLIEKYNTIMYFGAHAVNREIKDTCNNMIFEVKHSKKSIYIKFELVDYEIQNTLYTRILVKKAYIV